MSKYQKAFKKFKEDFKKEQPPSTEPRMQVSPWDVKRFWRHPEHLIPPPVSLSIQ